MKFKARVPKAMARNTWSRLSNSRFNSSSSAREAFDPPPSVATRRVVVTGLGLVTPLGCGVETTWKRLIGGGCGIRSITPDDLKISGFDKETQLSTFQQLTSKVAAIVPSGSNPGDFDEDLWFKSKEQRTIARFIGYALCAADEALRDANWLPSEQDEKERMGVSIGGGTGSISDILDASQLICEKRLRRLSPFFIPRILINMAAGHVSMKYGFQGPNHAAVTACATGAHSIGDATRMVQFGDADIMVAGGTESSIDALSIAGFCRSRALTTKFNSSPEESSRPFDCDRDGFVCEGSGIMILEELEHARRRGAKIYAEVRGYGMSDDAYHISQPHVDGRGAILAMTRALKQSGLHPEQVDYVNAHATSTPLGDAVEANAIKSLFSEHATSGALALSSTKGPLTTTMPPFRRWWDEISGPISDGDLDRLKESAASVDEGQGLVEIYTRPWGRHGHTALHFSAFHGSTDIIKYLIEELRLDVNLKEPIEILGLDDDLVVQRGQTVLNAAIEGKHPEIVAYLISRGADVNLGDMKGVAALHLAVQEDFIEILSLLISNGADIEASSYFGTPLQIAARRGRPEIMKILLRNNAKPNAMVDYMIPPLRLTMHFCELKCCKLLLKAGADPNLWGSRHWENGGTPLNFAAYCGYTGIIECLCRFRADPNLTNHEGMTPLEVALLRNKIDAAKILLPHTTPDPTILDWTLTGIQKALRSEERMKKREQMSKDNFMEANRKAEEAYHSQDYLKAIYWFNQAEICDPAEAAVFLSRSKCWVAMKNGSRALDDAYACIRLKPDWAEAHFWDGMARELLEDFAGAERAYKFALKLEPGNNMFQLSLEIVQLQLSFRIAEAEAH